MCSGCLVWQSMPPQRVCDALCDAPSFSGQDLGKGRGQLGAAAWGPGPNEGPGSLFAHWSRVQAGLPQRPSHVAPATRRGDQVQAVLVRATRVHYL